ncbi:hypothetical protein [Pseudarthrobacter sp. LT1]|jgi:hypothetical protein|uniref:hypothetical protein n=1 Tax=Pseudarthrobacter sp. LT1 TaxID=3111450 RepID=UPI002D77304E|nr:hypothetical protein [Pseudarthrobacter sp. LT1]WRT15836.1 hypothetical protein VIK36_10260 [Pseudarthrobacter sp. LT1]
MATFDSRSFYTRGDSFSVGDSREHVERALLDFGATDVLFNQRGRLSAIAFRACGRQFRILISLPQPHGIPAVQGDVSAVPGREVTTKALELVARRFWHAFALSTDAKLAAVAAGVATLESEFLAHVVLPGNHTVIEELEPAIASAYQSGQGPLIGNAAARGPDQMY